MPYIYFAKFNINEEIYNVYKDKNLLDKLIFDVYQGLRPEVTLRDEDGSFKFVHLDKNPDRMTVSGRLVVYAPGTNVEYDPSTDDLIEQSVDKKAKYITFYFDVRNEIIGFVPKRNFSKKLFLEKFKALVEGSVDVGEVEIFIETDMNELEERLRIFNHVQEVTVRLIPPNGDREDFEDLMDTNADEIKETNATKFDLSLLSTAKRSINLGAKYVNKWIKAVGRGYGRLTVVGKTTTGESAVIRSEDDAPYKKPVNDNNKDSIPTIGEKSRAGIVDLLAIKAMREGMKANDKKPKAPRQEE